MLLEYFKDLRQAKIVGNSQLTNLPPVASDQSSCAPQATEAPHWDRDRQIRNSASTVPATLGNSFTVGDDVKLTGSSRHNHRRNTEPLLYQGHETRSLCLVVLSSRAGKNLDLHSVLRSHSVRAIPVDLGREALG